MKIIIFIFFSLSALFGASTLELLNEISNDTKNHSIKNSISPSVKYHNKKLISKEKKSEIEYNEKQKPLLLTKNPLKKKSSVIHNSFIDNTLYSFHNDGNITLKKHHELMTNGYTILNIKQNSKSLSFFILIRNDNKICSKNINSFFNDVNIQKMNICGYKMEIERKSLKDYFIILYNDKNYYDITINSDENSKRFNTQNQKNSFKAY